MTQLWDVTGGVGLGGILVRTGRDLKSPEAAERLSTGAVVLEEEVVGNRLRYKRLSGTGPETGWVSVTLKDKPLLVRRPVGGAAAPADVRRSAAAGEPGQPTGDGDSAGAGVAGPTSAGPRSHAAAAAAPAGGGDGDGLVSAGEARSAWRPQQQQQRPTPPALPTPSTATTVLRPAGWPIRLSDPSQKREAPRGVLGAADTPQALRAPPRFDFSGATPAAAGSRRGASAEAAAAALPFADQLARLKELLAALSKPVESILSIRAEMERGTGNLTVQQTRLNDQETRLTRALEEVRIAADRLDPPTMPPPRLRLRCASTNCPFRVHTREGLGGYCCTSCFKSCGHGVRCERVRAPAGAKQADKAAEPVSAEQLAQIELDEAVRLAKARTCPKPALEPDNTWLATDPRWSRSGKAAVGKWVSSIIDDEFGNPDNSGPKQLLEGGIWTSRRGRRANQWIIFDLGKDTQVTEVRTRGHYVNTTFNPRRMQWQSGPSIEGPWTTLVTFSGSQDSDWVIAAVSPPATSRWWRLFIVSNWGAYDYVWLHGLALRVTQEDGENKEPQRASRAEDGAARRWQEGLSSAASIVDGPPAQGGGAAGGDVVNGPDAGAGGEATVGEGKVKDQEKDVRTEDGDEGEKKEDSNAHQRWTQADLRKSDESWEQLRGYQKLLFHALFCDRVLFLEDKPYIDCKWHNVEEYAAEFLKQPSEMGWSLDFEPDFFCELAYEGFNPTSIEIPSDNDLMVQVLTPCFEPERNVLRCLSTHVSKKARKRAKHYWLSVDAAYDDVMLGCVRQHGEGWLYRGERWVLRKLRREGYTGPKDIKISLHSFELWDSKGELVAGDLGYTIGGVYVSQTGFHREGSAGAGEVQLVLTAALLHRLGHEWFDLGQARTYKAALGAETLGRRAWLERFRSVRDRRCRLSHARVSGAELLDQLMSAMKEQPNGAKVPTPAKPESARGSVAGAEAPPHQHCNGTPAPPPQPLPTLSEAEPASAPTPPCAEAEPTPEPQPPPPQPVEMHSPAAAPEEECRLA